MDNASKDEVRVELDVSLVRVQGRHDWRWLLRARDGVRVTQWRIMCSSKISVNRGRITTSLRAKLRGLLCSVSISLSAVERQVGAIAVRVSSDCVCNTQSNLCNCKTHVLFHHGMAKVGMKTKDGEYLYFRLFAVGILRRLKCLSWRHRLRK